MTNRELLERHVASMLLLIRHNDTGAYHAARNAAHYAQLVLQESDGTSRA